MKMQDETNQAVLDALRSTRDSINAIQGDLAYFWSAAGMAESAHLNDLNRCCYVELQRRGFYSPERLPDRI